tara:strand:- start:1414 stop:2070 length:657 start_codon:yes stop_codon:yes gene_type:complete
MKKNDEEEFVIKFLKKNKNIFLKYPELVEILNFPNNKQKSSKVVDLNIYRYQKIKNNYDELKLKMLELIKAANSHVVSQKRVLKTSLKILNTKSLSKLINLILDELGSLLGCEIVNCFYTGNNIINKRLMSIDNRIAVNFFKDKPQTYLNQNPKGIVIFFPNRPKVIKSYVLLKIIYKSDRLIVALGSKNKNKFSKNQQVDLIEHLIQIIQVQLVNLN